MTELRQIDGNGHIPDEAAPRRCGCCRKLRTDPVAIVMFGTLVDAAGRTWPICGKCLSAMWRKRAPKIKPAR